MKQLLATGSKMSTQHDTSYITSIERISSVDPSSSQSEVQADVSLEAREVKTAAIAGRHTKKVRMLGASDCHAQTETRMHNLKR